MGLGMIFAGLSGAGKSAQQSLQQTQKYYDEESLLRERASLEVEKTNLIDKNKADIAAQPFNRFKDVAKNYANEEVPITADPVQQTTSEGAERVGLNRGGLINMTRDQVAAYKNPDMLIQYDKQLAADQEIANEKLGGKTRKRTSDEILNAALDEVKVSDPEAYSKVKEALGKAGEFDFKVAQEKNKVAATDKKLEQDQKNDDRRYNLLVEQVKSQAEKEGYAPTAMMQNVKLMQDLGIGVDEIKNYITDKKPESFQDSVRKMASEITKANPDLPAEDAVKKATELVNSIKNIQDGQLSVNPPQAAIDYLKQHPETATQFKAKYPGFDMSTIKDLDKNNRGSSGTIQYR